MRNVPFILSSEVYVDEQKEWISKELGQCREPAVNGWFLDSRPRRKAVKFEVVLHQKAPGVLIPTQKVYALRVDIDIQDRGIEQQHGVLPSGTYAHTQTYIVIYTYADRDTDMSLGERENHPDLFR
ncbi:hypothetical protein TGRH88_071900 [Toxoplasma gondii]|uniref:Uncharacterized protein n=1 Tax=Toxoplasma gondii TaxID=5811 RepID=A0A7J6K3G6_TOXGO|nr:hypothetical protein TGRH88_071900 [Toxoplasma gondii]